MRITGAKKLNRQLGDLPVAIRKHVTDAIRKSTNEGVRVAQTLASVDTGQTRDALHAEFFDGGMTGVVVAVRSNAPRDEKDRAYSIEHGRKKGDHGTTAGSQHIWRTRQFLAKRNAARIKRAVNKAAKEAFNGG